MIDAAGLLRDARGRVEHGWCQHAAACDRAGHSVDPWEPSADAWSLLGAIVAGTEPSRLETGELTLDELQAALGALAKVIDDPSLALWNDQPGRAAAEVVQVLDEALALAER